MFQFRFYIFKRFCTLNILSNQKILFIPTDTFWTIINMVLKNVNLIYLLLIILLTWHELIKMFHLADDFVFIFV